MPHSTAVRLSNQISSIAYSACARSLFLCHATIVWLMSLGLVYAQAAEPEGDAAAPADTALVQDGLLSQIFARIGGWFHGLLDQLRLAGSALVQARGLGQWWADVSSTPGAREAIFVGAMWVMGIVALAWCLEWVAHRLLRRPRQLVEEHAQRRESASLLRRMPYAITDAALYWIPLLAFLATTGVMSNAFLTGNRAYFVVLALANAYAGVRVALVLARLLVNPTGVRLRLFAVSDEAAIQAYGWARVIAITAGVGIALGESLVAFGAGVHFQTLVLKFTSLVVHIMFIVLVVRSRERVAAVLRGPVVEPGAARSGLVAFRGFVAEVWVFIAIVFIAALWVVWALSVENGFHRVIHFVATTAGVLIAARVVAILVFGALDTAFARIDPLLADRPAASGGHYLSILRFFLKAFLVIATVLALLYVWGAPISAWFAAGTVGRRFASACWTIAIAVLLAVIAWEAAGYALQRRVNQWNATGDTARVARLRTLMPIMRSALFVVIGLVVLFTALSEFGVNTAPLLASAGLLSAALAFGSQNLVKDFVTGIFLLMENTMQVGDGVTVAGVSGIVEHLSVRTVRLRAGDGSLHVVPFSSVTTVNNTNRGLGNAAVRVSVTADADMTQVYEVLNAIGKQMRSEAAYQNLILADLDIWGVDQIDGASVTVAGQIRTIDRGRWAVQREFNRRVLLRFRETGIRLANPRETLVISAGMQSAAAVAVAGTGAGAGAGGQAAPNTPTAQPASEAPSPT